MKPTRDEIKTLKVMGFSADSFYDTDESGWWSLADGWGFRIDAIPDIETLVKRLMAADLEAYKESL